MKKLLFLIPLIFLFACNDGYRRTTVTLPDGFSIQVRLADTPEKTEKGLMFVKHLPENEGMLFLFDEEDTHYFWMKNTLIDLDIIYLSKDKTITQMYERVPHTYTYTPDHEIPFVKGEGLYVLEAAAGTSTRQGLKAGDKLDFSL